MSIISCGLEDRERRTEIVDDKDASIVGIAR